jgi:cell division protein FtsB
MRYLNLALLLVLAGLQFRLWHGTGSIPDLRRLQRVHDEQVQANAEQRERNRSLGAEVVDLKQGLDALEERARSEMGLIRADETFFQYLTVRDPAPALVAD